MTKQKWRVGNSRTVVKLDDDWRVLDVGSGHQPNLRADVLLDKYFEDSASRSGAGLVTCSGKMVHADAMRMPFVDQSFDYAIASHIAEHIPDPVAFCRELSRVSKRGYIETPSKFTEITRGTPYHLWYVLVTGEELLFEPAKRRKRNGVLGNLYYHLCTFDRPWMHDSYLNVSNSILRYIFRAIGFVLRRIPIWMSKDLVYTRFYWSEECPARVAIG
jgi:hypothetical protein